MEFNDWINPAYLDLFEVMTAPFAANSLRALQTTDVLVNGILTAQLVFIISTEMINRR